MDIFIRPLAPPDLPLLARLDANYVADAELALEREQDGLNVTFRLVERARAFAYVKRAGYDFGAGFQAELAARIAVGQGLYLAAEHDGQIVGFLDVEPDGWRPTATMLWVAVDRPWRGHGIGRRLIERAIDWTRSRGLRALVLETQTTNIDACRFYLRVGFTLSGVQDPYYFDERVAEEQALFWTYEV
jgi:ribosomal protein S18 acetylase RimI-like enzyme